MIDDYSDHAQALAQQAAALRANTLELERSTMAAVQSADAVVAAMASSSIQPGANCTGGEINGADTCWVLLSFVLVLSMIPGLALFEAGLLRAKNTLSIMVQILAGVCVPPTPRANPLPPPAAHPCSPCVRLARARVVVVGLLRQ